jgi:1,6-anhydro-N-acetylmuramate kinase
MNEQLERVGLNLNQAIVRFWEIKLKEGTDYPSGARFTATELRQYVQHHNFGTAPSSADRVMRNLRKQGKINYALVNRAKSLYQAIPLEGTNAQ